MLDRCSPRHLMVALVLVLGLMLAACAGGPETAEVEPPDGDAANADDQPAGQTEGDPADEEGGSLTVYSGRSLELVGPILERFSELSGIEVSVRDGDTAELAAQILEEGDNSPADVFFAQDAGALGALARADVLTLLDDELLEQVDPRFADPAGRWIGVSGRARVLAWNTELLTEDELPGSVMDLTEPEWAGRVSWAPTNGSFQAFVTAMRAELGDEATTDWVEGMIANDVAEYPNNTTQVEAVGRGEIEIGIVNHYYLYRFLDEDPDFPVDNHFLGDGDIGALINIAGLGILTTSDQTTEARELIAFLLDDEAQQHFSEETFEYPLTGAAADDRMPDLDSLATPDIDLSDLDDLEGTLELLRQAGAL